MNTEHYRKWIAENVVLRAEAMQITGQSAAGFDQAVKTGYIPVFVEYGDARKTRLYLRSALEEYAKNKREPRGMRRGG